MPLNHVPFYLANIIIHSAVYIYFFINSFESKLRFSYRATVIGGCFYTLVTIVTILLFFEQEAPFHEYALLASAIWVLFTLVTCIMFITSNYLQLVFILFITFAIQNSVIYIAKIIDSFKIFPQISKFDQLNYLILTLIVLATYLPIMKYIYLDLNKRAVNLNANFSYLNRLCILPIAFYLFIWISHFESFSSITFHYTIRELLVVIAMNIVGLLSCVISYQSFLKTIEMLTFQQHASLISKQLEMQKAEYKQLIEYNMQTARQRHDWRQHMVALKGFAKEKNYDALESYLTKYVHELTDEDVAPISRNTVVDVILRHFVHLAKQNDVEVTTDVNIPEQISISDLNLCVVFGNLVENAVQACAEQVGRKKFLKIRATTVGNQLLIFIQNSYSTTLKRVNGIFHSTKHTGDGIGISSVESLVVANGGTLQINFEDNVFTVDVLLNF